MFKTAATKFAHNSTLPALGGNQDLRPLQDLITAEKAVLISLQKLSVDYSKAADALRVWGLGEGDDLGDILSASTTVLNIFSSALSQYASHGHEMREQLKDVRTREELLDDLKRRRRTVMKKAEDAEKKLSKMSPEHKNLAVQTDMLNRLRDEIRTIDSDIMIEEAAIGDFKRTSTRIFMGLKFGGLLECCDKGKIAGEFGKLLVSEISEEITQPGLPRASYYGLGKTESLVAEAQQCAVDIQLSTVPTAGFRDRRQYDQKLPAAPQSQEPGFTPNGGYGWPQNDPKPQPPPPTQYQPPVRSFSNDQYRNDPDSASMAAGPPYLNQSYASHQPQPQVSHPQGPGSSFSHTLPTSQPARRGSVENHSVDDFGVNRPSGSFETTNPSGGRFATVPVKRGGYVLQDPALAPQDEAQSLSASIAQALGTPPVTTNNSQTLPLRLGPKAATSFTSTQDHTNEPSPALPAAPPTSISQPPPSTRPLSLAHPTPGVALPNFEQEWTLPPLGHTRQISQLSDNDDALLAYMTAADVDSSAEEPPPQTAVPTHSLGANPLPSTSIDDDRRISQHVRFGQAEDSEEQKGRGSEYQTRAAVKLSRSPTPPIGYTQNLGEKGRGSFEAPDKEPETSSMAPTDTSKPPAIHPPAFSPEMDEKALDAAAAREVSRELEALKSPHEQPLDTDQRSSSDSIPDRGRQLAPGPGYGLDTKGRTPSPLLPPSAPFAKRSVSPHPYAELNNSSPYSQYSPAQAYAQSYQDPSSYGRSPQNVSPAQAYAQSYQNSGSYSQSQPPDSPLSTVRPPRFQALDSNPVPPRFQGSQSHSSASPSTLPPRFQAVSTAQAPSPSISLSEHQHEVHYSPPKADPVYRNPSEYPKSLGTARSNLSLNNASPVAPPVPGGRTISASAFKRPQKNPSLDNPDPFAQRSLPNSPYATSRDPPSVVAPQTQSQPPASLLPAQGLRQSVAGDDDHYDYINAYMNSNPNSPMKPEFAPSAQGHDGNAAGFGRPGGYHDGRFSTNLDSDLR